MEFWVFLSLAVTLVATPIIFMPLKLIDGYILPQIGVAGIGIAITLILFLTNGEFNLTLSGIIAFIYFIYLMMTNSWSTINHSSIKDVPLVFAYLFGYIIAVSLFQDKINAVGVSLAVFSVAMFTSLYGVGQKFLIDPLFPKRLEPQTEYYKGVPKEKVHEAFRNKNFQDNRSISTIGNTNFACGYFVSTFPFIFYLCIEVSPYFAIGFIPLLTVIVFTKSRNGIVSLFFAGLFFLLLISKKGWVFDAWNYMFLGTSTLKMVTIEIPLLLFILYIHLKLKELGVFALLASEKNDLSTMLDIEKFDNEHPISTLRFRIRFWRAAIELIKNRPFSGFGLRTYRREVYGAQGKIHSRDGKFLGEQYQTPQPRECHNDFIENFVEGGIAGGLFFLCIIGVVMYNGIIAFDKSMGVREGVLIAFLLSSVILFCVNAFFGFPLRLGSSATTFFVGLALLEAATGNYKSFIINVNPLLLFLIILSLIPMIWLGIIKQNLANHYCAKASFLSDPVKKEMNLLKAIKVLPRETAFRSRALMGYLDSFPEESETHAEILRGHYDGMVPAWAASLQCAIVKIVRKQFEDGARFLYESIYYLPRFKEAKMHLGRVWPFVPFPRRGIGMKQVSDEAKEAIKHYQAEINSARSQMETAKEKIDSAKNKGNNGELIIGQIILSEKARLRIPQNWVFAMDVYRFIQPQEVDESYRLLQMGPTQIPVAIKKNPELEQEIKQKELNAA